MDVLRRILGVNYRTTILGIGVIVAAVGRILLAWKTKDFSAIADDSQLIVETITALLIGLGLYIAKDANVTGVGSQAKTVGSDGIVKNVEGEKIGTQAETPPQSIKGGIA